MLEIRLKHSELPAFENRSQNIYNHNPNKQKKRIIKSSHTAYLKSDRLQTSRNQWLRRKVKDTKFIIFANSRNLKNMALNPM